MELDDTKNTSAQFKPAAKTYNLSDVDDELYKNLPGSVQRQFSVEQLNLLIRQINTYLNERNQGMLNSFGLLMTIYLNVIKI